MKMTIGTGLGAVSCTVQAARTFSFSSDRPLPGLLPDTAGYAACRFLCRCPELCRTLTAESRALRLARRGGGRTLRRTVCVPARLLELPGSKAYLRLTVRAAGVTVESLKLVS